MSNKVLITNEQNAVKVPSGLRILIRRSCNAVLEYEKFDGPAEISVTFVDNARIHELNKQYRDKDATTDVLSFPMAENGEYDIDEDNGCKILGDIVISMERAMEQAELYGHSLQREVAYLTVHSMLHLLGYDHESSALHGGIHQLHAKHHKHADGQQRHAGGVNVRHVRRGKYIQCRTQVEAEVAFLQNSCADAVPCVNKAVPKPGKVRQHAILFLGLHVQLTLRRWCS